MRQGQLRNDPKPVSLHELIKMLLLLICLMSVANVDGEKVCFDLPVAFQK